MQQAAVESDRIIGWDSKIVEECQCVRSSLRAATTAAGMWACAGTLSDDSRNLNKFLLIEPACAVFSVSRGLMPARS